MYLPYVVLYMALYESFSEEALCSTIVANYLNEHDSFHIPIEPK